MAKVTVKKDKKSATKVAGKKSIKFPEKFTAQTIINYVSEKNDISRVTAKEIIEDLFDVICEGVSKGERVPVGKLGKIYIKIRPATKERMGRNPITGEEIKIAPKKATKVPKFTFSKSYKEQALKAKVK